MISRIWVMVRFIDEVMNMIIRSLTYILLTIVLETILLREPSVKCCKG